MIEFLLWLVVSAVLCLVVFISLEAKKCPSCKQSNQIETTAVTPLGMSTQTRNRSIMRTDGSRYSEPYQVTITKYIEDKQCGNCGHKWKKWTTKTSSSDSWFL